MVIERAALVRLMLAHHYREDQIADLLKISRATVAKLRQQLTNGQEPSLVRPEGGHSAVR